MITLQKQIERLEVYVKHNGGEDNKALLASLRRLQAIEAQEPVGWQFYQNDQWSHGSEHNNHRKNTEGGGFPVRNLYALPVSPKIPEGMRLV